MKTKWGILSTAKIGIEKVIPAIQKAHNCEVTAIGSRKLSAAKNSAEKLGIAKAYGSYEELLADPEIEIIYNPLPNHLHLPLTEQALAAGKHVLCEKPIGLNTAEARKLVEVAARYPLLKVMEAFMYRFHPQWKKVKELVVTGAIGEVRTIQSFFSYFNDDPENIRNKADIGGGALMDIGCYCISFPRFIFGIEPQKVVGLVDRDPALHIDRVTSGMLDFGAGLSSGFTCSTQLSPFQRAQIVGTKGRIEVEIPVNAPADVPTKIKLFKDGKAETLTFIPADQYQLQAEAFADAVLKNEPVPTSLSDAVNNMKVIDAIFQSEDHMNWVKLGR